MTNREATQRTAILGVLLKQFACFVDMDCAEALLDSIMKEIIAGPCAWAFEGADSLEE